MKTLIVHAGNTLSQEDFNDDEKRASQLRRVEELVTDANVQGVRIDSRLAIVCALFVRGSDQALLSLQNHLQMNGVQTTLDDGRPAFRPAR